MIPCTVTRGPVGYLVEFEDGRTLLLQSDYDYVNFGVSCGVIPAPNNWDGRPSTLRNEWWEYDLEEITKCPEDYYDIAELPE